MARNTNRDRLIETFMSRNRRKTPGGYRPQKQGTTPDFRPVKQGTLTSKVPGASGSANPQNLEAAKQYAAQSARARRPKRNQGIARY